MKTIKIKTNTHDYKYDAKFHAQRVVDILRQIHYAEGEVVSITTECYEMNRLRVDDDDSLHTGLITTITFKPKDQQ